VPLSLWLAPLVSVPLVWLMQALASGAAWPWWWSVVLGLAWAPLLWLPAGRVGARAICMPGLAGLLMLVALTGVALAAHAVPLGLHDRPDQRLGAVVLVGMLALYLCLVVLQLRPQALGTWRRWSYAGFYVDEIYTRAALRLWPVRWINPPAAGGPQ
jgi:NAD(P)H-quinone oxidoreductase subunit 5